MRKHLRFEQFQNCHGQGWNDNFGIVEIIYKKSNEWLQFNAQSKSAGLIILSIDSDSICL